VASLFLPSPPRAPWGPWGPGGGGGGGYTRDAGLYDY